MNTRNNSSRSSRPGPLERTPKQIEEDRWIAEALSKYHQYEYVRAERWRLGKGIAWCLGLIAVATVLIWLVLR